mgnify:CR=1 FL=1
MDNAEPIAQIPIPPAIARTAQRSLKSGERKALAAAKKQGKDEAGTRKVLEEWHEAISNTLNKENMK